MPTLNPFSDGGVTLDGYTGGAFKDSKGFSGHQPFPVFSGWDATAALPNGMGNNDARVSFGWTHGGYLYLWIYSGTYSEGGIYRRSLVGTPPTHTTPDAFISVSTLFGSDEAVGIGIYDEVNERIYLHRYNGSSAVTGCIGCWDMDDWPFSAGNAQWIAMDTSHGSYVAGKITRFIHDCQLSTDGSKLYATAYYSGSVYTIDTSDGSLLGEWNYSTSYAEDSRFHMLGFDDANGYPIGGAYPAAAGDGKICTWNPTTPTAWTEVATIMPASTFGVHRGALHGHMPWHLRSPSIYWVTRDFGFTPGQLALLGLSNDWFAWFIYTYYTDTWGPAYYIAKKDGTEFHRLAPANVGSLGGLTGEGSSIPRPIITNPGGVSYILGTAFGTPRIIDLAGQADEEGCPYFQCVDHPSYRFTYTITGPTTLKRILLSLAETAINRECSRNPGKHRFRIEKKPSGGSWGSPSEWRAGAALLHLDQEYDGDPAWPTFADGDQLRITHQMTSGFFDTFEPAQAAAGCEKSGTTLAIGALSDIGMPSEVLPLVDYEQSLPNAGKTYGRPIVTDAHIIKPEITGAEITS